MFLPYNGPGERDQLNEEFLDYQSKDIEMPDDPSQLDFEKFLGDVASEKNKIRIIFHPWEYPLM